MNLTNYVPKAVSSTVGRQLLLGQKHSPIIMFSAGVVGMVATTVLASRATLRVYTVLEEAQAELHTVHEAVETVENYTEELEERDRTIVRVQTGIKLAKLYAPAIGVGLISIGLLTGSHVVLTRRNAGLIAAYGVMEKSFAEYRKRVADEYGTDKERDLYYSGEDRVVKENGKDKVVRTADTNRTHSPYGRIFHEGNKEWQGVPEYNLIFLKAQQNYLNDLLRTRGHVFLNDVYDALGFDRTREGSVVGWLKDPKPGEGDGYIDFGVFGDDINERVFDFVIGRESAIVLDFNVDGTIWNKI